MVITLNDMAQLLYDLFGDNCPCNYNNISDEIGSECGSECPAEISTACWKRYILHKVKAMREQNPEIEDYEVPTIRQLYSIETVRDLAFAGYFGDERRIINPILRACPDNMRIGQFLKMCPEDFAKYRGVGKKVMQRIRIAQKLLREKGYNEWTP